MIWFDLKVFDMTENYVQSEISASEGSSSVRKAGAFIQSLGLNMLMIGLLALLAFLVWQRFINKQDVAVFSSAPQPVEIEQAESVAQPAENDAPVNLAPMGAVPTSAEGIMRKTDLNTVIPSRPRTDVITYTVQTGDTLFSIADNYSLKPETVLWGNFEVLNDNPHLLKPKQVLNILPINGTYYEWQEGDTLSSVASFFKVETQDIVNYSGNFLDLTQTTENSDAGIQPGTWVIVPGGKRAIKDWGPPAITRQNAACSALLR